MSKNMSKILICVGVLVILISVGLLINNIIVDNRAGQAAQLLLDEMLGGEPVSPEIFDEDVIADILMIMAMAEDEEFGQAEDYLGQRTIATPQEYIPDEDGSELEEVDESDDEYPTDEAENTASPPPPPPPAVLTIPRIGILHIPAMDVTLPVISETTDALLNISITRFSGRVTDRPERLVIAGHNFRSHFAGLADLNIGDTATFTTMDGDMFYYEVTLITTVHMTETEYVLSGDDWDITLFTCTRDRTMRTVVRLRETG